MKQIGRFRIAKLLTCDEQDNNSVNNNDKGDSDLETCVDYFALA